MKSQVRYDDVIAAIEEAGYFVSGPHHHDDDGRQWQRIIPGSKRRKAGGYTGKSFWISPSAGQWFAGTWIGWIYRIRDADSVAEMCIRWMAANPDETCADFEQWLRDDSGLQRIEDAEFDVATDDA